MCAAKVERRGRRARMETRATVKPKVVAKGAPSGRYKPLKEAELPQVHEAALKMLAETGVGSIWPENQKLFLDAGGWLNDAGRVCLPGALVEKCLDQAAKSVTVHGQDDSKTVEFKPGQVNLGTGGLGVFVFDPEKRSARESVLADVYDSTRMAEAMDNVHCVTRQLVARDMETLDDLDINTAYAVATATTKPFGMGTNRAVNVPKVATMMDMILGEEGAFRKRPICWAGGTFMVSPLRVQEDEQRLLEAAVREGFPVTQMLVPQSGTSGPASLAGTLALSVAEALFILCWVNLLKPGHPMIVGCWPFTSDLRTGAFSGGGAEQALLMAASAQMMNYYGLPNSIAAGMTDSKLSDFQSGTEKAMTLTAAALSGSPLIYAYPGMLSSIMGLSYAQMVLDDELMGSVLRLVRGIEVDDERLAAAVVRESAIDPGHFISHPQTMNLMETEFLYPTLGDRTSLNEWLETTPHSIEARASDAATEILSQRFPRHVSETTDDVIRKRFDIKLPREKMHAGGWSSSGG